MPKLYYFRKTSYPNRSNVQETTIKNNILINEFPFIMAVFAPSQPPKALQAAMGRAIIQTIFPFAINNKMEPRFVARFMILAFADAVRKSWCKAVIKLIIKKLPVPGPINPS